MTSLDTSTKARLAEAASLLLEDPDAPNLYRGMMEVHDVAQSGIPVRLTGRYAPLNALIDTLLEDHDYGSAVLDHVEKRRAAAQLPPLEPDGFDRKAYMRELMATKRDRQRRLVEIANLLRSEVDKIKGMARMEFERVHAARWFAVRDDRIAALKDRLGRRLKKEEITALLSQLWKDVDTELDEFEDFARAEMLKPLHARAPGGYRFKLQPKKGS